MQDAILSALQPYGLKTAGRNQYRCNAPWRAGSNSRGVAITIDPSAPGGGLWHDHVAQEGGDFRELARRLNIPVPEDIGPKTPAKDPAYAGLGDYAQAHGVPAAIFATAGWREDMHFCPEHGRKRRALLFRTRTGERARFIDGEKPKYISPKGYTSCMYGLDRAVALAEQTGQPLVLANGEASTVAAQHFRVAATCQTAGEKRLSDANLAALQVAYPAGEILLAPDCDPTGRKTASDLYEQLTTAGYSVRVVDLNGAQGFDLANFAQLHQEGTAAALLALHDLPPPQADASMYLREMERLRQEVEHLRAELRQYKEREAWQAKILARQDIKLNEKAVMIGIEPILHMRRELASRKDEHTGTVPAAYKRLGEFVATSPSTVGRVIELGEKLDMWRRDPETKQSKDGYEVQLQRLELRPAFDDPALAEKVERKQHGGARPNAGRRPKCPNGCPTITPIHEKRETMIQHICAGCGDILHEETIVTRRELQPDDFIQDEIGDEAQQAAAGNQDEIEKACTADAGEASVTPELIQDETEDVYNVSSISSLPAVPPILEETFDLAAAIQCADKLPLDLSDPQRMAYKTSLVWLQRREPEKAKALLERIHVPQAQAIVAHLAARHAGQAVAA